MQDNSKTDCGHITGEARGLSFLIAVGINKETVIVKIKTVLYVSL
ncbi:MAG: hypothetical protein JWQ66_4215 [Mucilaginibacter sp.]|nr:hypothetical protein [Mucilaginibacter sp.]